MSLAKLNFKKMELSDIAAVRPYFKNMPSRTCDYTVGGMFMWRDYFKMEYAIRDGVLFSRLMGTDGAMGWNIPLLREPGDISDLIRLVTDYARDNGEFLRFCTVPEEYLPFFDNVPGARFSLIEQTEYFDYLYSSEDFISLEGEKYASHRNHIHQFSRFATNCDYRDIDAENLPEVITFFKDYYVPSASESGSESRDEENAKTMEVLENFSLYGMSGGVLSVNGVAVGFSLCETIGDTTYIHVEKADRGVPGAYPALAWMTAKRFAGVEGVKYINREEDMGDPGLKKSKMSWHPTRLLKKYILKNEI